MKIEINTTAKGIEVANCIMRIAMEELEKNVVAREHHGLSKSDIKAAKAFQKAMVKSFLSDKNK